MSVVLVTDGYETIRPVIDCLHAQTVRDELEVVLVGLQGEGLHRAGADLDGFAAVQVVEVGSPLALGDARAAGVGAASAPLVFIGETHSFPHAGMAETLIRAHSGPWATVVPGFVNANPDGAPSWAAFLLDYGGWVPGVAAGEIDHAPIYNASYRRSVLLEFGDRLGSALRIGDEMSKGLGARGHRTYFEPAARIDHLNLSAPAASLRERYLAGLLIAAERTRRWSWRQRLLYLCGAPLLPAVYLSRVRAGVRAQRRDAPLPVGTVPMLLVSSFVKAAGEMIGYARGAGPAAEPRMMEYELNKVGYVSSRTP